MPVTAFFLGVLASILAAEVYLWLPTLALWLQRKLERIQESRGTDRFRRWQQTANNAPGAISKVTFLLGVLVVLGTLGGTGITKGHPTGERVGELKLLPRLVGSVLLMAAAVELAFVLRFDGFGFEQSRAVRALVVLIPLQLLSLWIVGIKDPFSVHRLQEFRLLILGFVGATVPLVALTFAAPNSFYAMVIPRSVLIINADLVIILFGGLGLGRRLWHEMNNVTR